MLDPIYRMTIKLLSNLVFDVKMLGFCHIYVRGSVFLSRGAVCRSAVSDRGISRPNSLAF